MEEPKLFDYTVYLDFVESVKEEQEVISCPVSSRETDASDFTITDEMPVVFSVSCR